MGLDGVMCVPFNAGLRALVLWMVSAWAMGVAICVVFWLDAGGGSFGPFLKVPFQLRSRG
jgi:hypothetical protein